MFRQIQGKPRVWRNLFYKQFFASPFTNIFSAGGFFRLQWDFALDKVIPKCYNKAKGRVIMMDVIKAKLDIVFKKLFTSDDDILRAFVGDMLDIPRGIIKQIKVENP